MFMEGPKVNLNNPIPVDKAAAISAKPKADQAETTQPKEQRGATNSTLGFDPKITGQALLLMQGADGIKPVNNFFKLSEIDSKKSEPTKSQTPETIAALPKNLSTQVEAILLDSPEATEKFEKLVKQAERPGEIVTNRVSPEEIKLSKAALIDINQDAFTLALRQALESDAKRSSELPMNNIVKFERPQNNHLNKPETP